MPRENRYHLGGSMGTHRLHTFRFGLLSAAFLTLAISTAGAEAAEIETIYVVPFTHNDVGFDATPKQMAANSVQSIDDAIEQAAADPQYVWNIETFWQMRHWLDAGKNPEPLLKLLRDGRFGLNSAYICPHTSVMKAWMLGPAVSHTGRVGQETQTCARLGDDQ